MEISASISQKDIKMLKFNFGKITRRTADLRPIFQVSTKDLRRDLAEVFRTQGAVMGERWVGLTNSTKKARIKAGFKPAPILVRTGVLRRSLLGGAGNVNIMLPTTWKYGTDISYAIYHQSTAPRKKIPRRPFLYMSPKTRGNLVRRIHKYVITGKL